MGTSSVTHGLGLAAAGEEGGALPVTCIDPHAERNLALRECGHHCIADIVTIRQQRIGSYRPARHRTSVFCACALAPVFRVNASEAAFSFLARFASIDELHFAGATYARVQNRDRYGASASRREITESTYIGPIGSTGHQDRRICTLSYCRYLQALRLPDPKKKNA